MRTNFSPIAEAARRHAAGATRGAAPAAASGSTPRGAAGELWCEWPRRMPSLPPFRGIRHALQQIQAIQTRHA